MRAALGLAAAILACEREPEPRAQTVLYLDTNVFVPGQGDTLLIERLDAAGAVIERRVHTAPNKSDWPVSFGVLPGARAARFRVRLYPESRVAIRKRDDSSVVSPGGADGGSYGAVDVGDPLPGFAVDRLVELPPPNSFQRVRVTLKGECMGVVADAAGNRSCDGRDDERPVMVAATVVERLSEHATTTAIGTWGDAIERPCVGERRAESGAFDEEVCEPGGVFFLGDERMASKHA